MKPTANTTAQTAMPMLAFLIPLFISSDKSFLQNINCEQQQAGYPAEVTAFESSNLPLRTRLGRDEPSHPTEKTAHDQTGADRRRQRFEHARCRASACQ